MSEHYTDEDVAAAPHTDTCAKAQASLGIACGCITQDVVAATAPVIAARAELRGIEKALARVDRYQDEHDKRVAAQAYEQGRMDEGEACAKKNRAEALREAAVEIAVEIVKIAMARRDTNSTPVIHSLNGREAGLETALEIVTFRADALTERERE